MAYHQSQRCKGQLTRTQLTFDEYDNWFPHPSPDNRNVAYIAYMEDQKGGHPLTSLHGCFFIVDFSTI
ncbi:MAG: hypothetical protein ABFC30_02925 [Proteiniphilum sp.]